MNLIIKERCENLRGDGVGLYCVRTGSDFAVLVRFGKEILGSVSFGIELGIFLTSAKNKEKKATKGLCIGGKVTCGSVKDFFFFLRSICSCFIRGNLSERICLNIDAGIRIIFLKRKRERVESLRRCVKKKFATKMTPSPMAIRPFILYSKGISTIRI